MYVCMYVCMYVHMHLLQDSAGHCVVSAASEVSGTGGEQRGEGETASKCWIV